MSNKWKVGLSIGIVAALFIAVLAIVQTGTQYQEMGVTRFDMLHLSAPTAVGSATPALMVDCSGVGNCFEIREAATPVFSINSGAVSRTGDDTVTGSFTVTGDTALGDAAGDTVTVTGDATIAGSRDATTGYDYFMTIDGEMTGIQNGAKTYGLYISMERPTGYGSGGGDLDDAGLKIRVDSHAVTTTAGTTLRGADVEAKLDNPDGCTYNVYGGSFSAKSDTSAGVADLMVALTANTQNNAAVTTTLMAADLRLMRQAATEPTNEHVLQVRNSSTSGSGADSAIYVTSDYGSSATTDSFDYGLDFSSAAINNAEIRGENGERLYNTTDTVWATNAFWAYGESTGVVVTSDSTITPTASYQPISSASAVTTSATTAIADGVLNGQILILVNENASDVITIKDSANTHLSGDIALGNDDTLMLMWDGADWLELATSNNS